VGNNKGIGGDGRQIVHSLRLASVVNPDSVPWTVLFAESRFSNLGYRRCAVLKHIRGSKYCSGCISRAVISFSRARPAMAMPAGHSRCGLPSAPIRSAPRLRCFNELTAARSTCAASIASTRRPSSTSSLTERCSHRSRSRRLEILKSVTREALILTSNLNARPDLRRNQEGAGDDLALNISIVCPTCSKHFGDSMNISDAIPTSSKRND
jgi:hypothetical protein